MASDPAQSSRHHTLSSCRYGAAQGVEHSHVYSSPILGVGIHLHEADRCSFPMDDYKTRAVGASQNDEP